MKRLGPYLNERETESVAKVFQDLGELVQIEHTYNRPKPGREKYEGFVIRGASA